MSDSQQFFATAPKGVVALLMDELIALGAEKVRERPAGAEFYGDLETAYRACLWLRTANRVLLPLKTFPAASPEALYAGIQTIDWSQHLHQDGTLAVDSVAKNSVIRHSQYASQKAKDAVVDQFRDRVGERPSVDLQQPDIRINVHILRDEATVSLDLTGDSLHRRGYRQEGGAAPLKENLAAAILLRAAWLEIAANGGALIDPMCGSGTLLIEAVMMAADIAPGMQRDYFGFINWRQHDSVLWQSLIDEAQQRKKQGLAKVPTVIGYDTHPKAIRFAQANVTAAGLDEHIRLARRDVSDLQQPENLQPGLVVINPPYGERLGEKETLAPLYQQLGDKLKQQFEHWQAVVFTGNVELSKNMGIRPHKQHNMFNGALECKLLRFDLEQNWFIEERSNKPRPLKIEALSDGAEMFANRLKKNLREMKRWAKREEVDCYRLYDADMPEYAVAVDLYHGEQTWVMVQEYEAPKSIDAKKAQTRLREVMTVLPTALGVPDEQIFIKVRRQQKGKAQYEKLAADGEFYQVHENGCEFWVNFTDYLDSGLFLDHRLTRAMLAELAKGKRFLNLFAYTGTATVYAAKGGALSTTTVDMSRTYLDWAQRNLALNNLTGNEHQLIQSDVLKWLDERASGAWGKHKFGLIFLDPPTFSTSKRMQESFDVQRDHVEMIRAAMKLLESDGILVFSNNFRRFKLDPLLEEEFDFEEVSTATIPRDFLRNKKIHRCWKVRLR